jgi:predicted acylesterase/phospholipase RssA
MISASVGRGRPRPRIGLALGAGGVLGAAWATGALAVLQQRVPVPVGDFDVIVGTSAGSVLAAALRCGLTVDEIVAYQREGPSGPLRALGSPDLGYGALPPWPRLVVGSPRLLLAALRSPHTVHPWVIASACLPEGRADHAALRDMVRDMALLGDERRARRPPSWARLSGLHPGANRANPADPASRANPATPASRANPANPANPANHASRANPANPSSLANPASRANPAEPANLADQERLGWLARLADGLAGRRNPRAGGGVTGSLVTDWAEDGRTWIVAVDYGLGHRVVFGRDDAPPASLPDAVAASCSVPGWFRPTVIGERRYVDGGVRSTASADLLSGLGLDEVYVLAPMASQVTGPPHSTLERAERVIRKRMTAALEREIELLRTEGVQVTLVTPGPDDLHAMGGNLMDPSRRQIVFETSLRTSADAFGAGRAA